MIKEWKLSLNWSMKKLKESCLGTGKLFKCLPKDVVLKRYCQNCPSIFGCYRQEWLPLFMPLGLIKDFLLGEYLPTFIFFLGGGGGGD